MVTRKTIKKAHAKLRPMALSIWRKILVWISGKFNLRLERHFPEFTNTRTRTTSRGVSKFSEISSLTRYFRSKFGRMVFIAEIQQFRNLRLNGKLSWFFKFLIVDIYSKYYPLIRYCFLPMLACSRASTGANRELSTDVFEPRTSTGSRDFSSLMRISPFSFKKSSRKC